MAAAWLLTLVAIAGAVGGAWLGESGSLTDYLGAAGGGLLLGISLFWLLPESAHLCNWIWAPLLALTAALAIAGLDHVLVRAGHSPRQGVIGPLLAATAIHSFIDGWSLRALAWQPMTNIAVAVGLALHKIPEGIAVGWLSRRALSSRSKAVLAAAGVELFTALGAYVQPHANNQALAAFGTAWTAGMLSFISGSFLFLGIHAVLPNWRRPPVAAVFIATLAAIATVRALGLPFV